MDITFNILKAIAVISVAFSILLVLARFYACYIRKAVDASGECSDSCSCKAVNDQITDSVTTEKPRRKQVKKRVSAIKDDKLVITKVEEKKPATKRGRKKKEL